MRIEFEEDGQRAGNRAGGIENSLDAATECLGLAARVQVHRPHPQPAVRRPGRGIRPRIDVPRGRRGKCRGAQAEQAQTKHLPFENSIGSPRRHSLVIPSN